MEMSNLGYRTVLMFIYVRQCLLIIEKIYTMTALNISTSQLSTEADYDTHIREPIFQPYH